MKDDVTTNIVRWLGALNTFSTTCAVSVRLLAGLAPSVYPSLDVLANAAPLSSDTSSPNSFKSSWICFSVRRCLRDRVASVFRSAESWNAYLSMARVERRSE